MGSFPFPPLENVPVPLHLLFWASSPTLEALAVLTYLAPSCPEPRTLGPSASQAVPPERPTGIIASAWPTHSPPEFLASENGIIATPAPELELGVILDTSLSPPHAIGHQLRGCHLQQDSSAHSSSCPHRQHQKAGPRNFLVPTATPQGGFPAPSLCILASSTLPWPEGPF